MAFTCILLGTVVAMGLASDLQCCGSSPTYSPRVRALKLVTGPHCGHACRDSARRGAGVGLLLGGRCPACTPVPGTSAQTPFLPLSFPRVGLALGCKLPCGLPQLLPHAPSWARGFLNYLSLAFASRKTQPHRGLTQKKNRFHGLAPHLLPTRVSRV